MLYLIQWTFWLIIMENENNLTSAALDWADWTYDSQRYRYYDGFNI